MTAEFFDCKEQDRRRFFTFGDLTKPTERDSAEKHLKRPFFNFQKNGSKRLEFPKFVLLNLSSH